MRKVLILSLLLIIGFFGSQFFGVFGSYAGIAEEIVRILTVFLLGFIMIHVGYEFDLDRGNLRGYAVDYGVAATAAAFPWIFCSVYFILFFYPEGSLSSFDAWTESLLAGRFAAPTSAGVLFSMLAAAGLSATWYFQKVRILAIFDDLDTVLLMIPLKMLIVGLRWQLGVIVVIMVVLLWLGWKNLHRLRIPVSWPWVLTYAGGITIVSELIYIGSKSINDVVPIHIEVLLPAFVLGCMIARPGSQPAHAHTPHESHGGGAEATVMAVVSGAFMVLVGLSMPAVETGGEHAMAWDSIALHVLAITVLANLGKMFPLFMYRREAHWKERLAICVGMWPRGEVGAGVLIISLSYGIGGDIVTIAALSLALNLILTGLFIVIVQRLLTGAPDVRVDAVREAS